MLSKNRTVLLLIVLVIVTAIYFFLDYNASTDRNFRTQLIDVDTSSINRIQISPPAATEHIVLLKENGSWVVKQDASKYGANQSRIRNFIGQMNEAKIKSLAANSPDDWENYKATAALGTSIRFLADADVLADVIVGKYEFLPARQQQQNNPYMRQPQGSMLSYARLNGEDAIYAIDGMVALGIGRTADEYRNNTITPELTADNIAYINFSPFQGEAFKLSKQQNLWLVDGVPADSARVAAYFKNISKLAGKAYTSEQLADTGRKSSIEIVNDNGMSVKISATQIDTVNHAVHSSINPTNTIKDAGEILNKLFIPKSDFLASEMMQ